MLNVIIATNSSKMIGNLLSKRLTVLIAFLLSCSDDSSLSCSYLFATITSFLQLFSTVKLSIFDDHSRLNDSNSDVIGEFFGNYWEKLVIVIITCYCTTVIFLFSTEINLLI